MGKIRNFKKAIISCFSLVIVLSLIFTFTAPTAYAIEVDAGSTPGSGGGHLTGITKKNNLNTGTLHQNGSIV